MAGFKPTENQIISWIENNFEFRTRKGGSEYLINNPFDSDTGYNFNISIGKGLCHDWRGDEWAGGKSRTFLRFVQIYRNCSFVDAYKEICGKNATIDAIYAKIGKNKTKEAKEECEYDIKLPEGALPLSEAKDSLNASMLCSWLNSRGVNNFDIEKYNLHYHSMHVVWPYYEYGSLVYWQERDRMNKFFRFPGEEIGVTKGMFLYGFDMIEPGQYIIITEAIFDCMTLGDQCLASGGAMLTKMQVRKIRALNPVDGVILAPDNDSAGIKSIVTNYKMIQPYFKKLYYAIPPKIEHKSGVIKDWNDLGAKKVMSWSDIRRKFESSIKPLDRQKIVKFMISGGLS